MKCIVKLVTPGNIVFYMWDNVFPSKHDPNITWEWRADSVPEFKSLERMIPKIRYFLDLRNRGFRPFSDAWVIFENGITIPIEFFS